MAASFPVDRERVLLVGHSMGAAQGLDAVQASPSSFAAFAALGGGRRARKAKELVDVPVFVGAGLMDFGLAGARRLHASLEQAGARRALLKVYPNTEHLMIVQVALPDVFRFFEQALR